MRSPVVFLLGALSGVGTAQEIPHDIASWIAPAPDGFQQQTASWNPDRRTLTVTYREWPQDEISVVVDGRELNAEIAVHELWRIPVTWKRETEEIGGQFVIGGITDARPGPNRSASCGVAWRTAAGRRVLIQWRPGRSSKGWRSVAAAVEREDRGQVPRAVIEAYLARHRSVLTRNSDIDGPAWAAEELLLFWNRFGEELASDRPTAAIVQPNAFPVAIPFLEFRFTRDLTRAQRLARYAELSAWMAKVRAEDFEWDRSSGAFRFRAGQITGARRVAVPRRRPIHPIVVPALRQDIVWELGLPVARVAQIPYETLWTTGTHGAREWLFVIGERGGRYELSVLDLSNGRLLRRAALPFAEINHLRFVDGKLFVDVTQDGARRYGVFDLETLTVSMDIDPAALLEELHPSSWGWDVMRQALGIRPDEPLDTVLPGKAGIYVRATAGPEALLYALDRDDHRARWVLGSVAGTRILERSDMVYARVAAIWPSWTGLDSRTGAVRWIVGLAEPGLWNAGLSGDRMVLLGGHEAFLIDAGSGMIDGRVPLVETIERGDVDAGKLGLHLTGNGLLVVSRDGAGPMHRFRFYRWP